MKTDGPSQFADLSVRVITGVAVAAVGLLAVGAGGIWLLALVAVAVGAMVWELARMVGVLPGPSLGFGAAAAVLLVILAQADVYSAVFALLVLGGFLLGAVAGLRSDLSRLEFIGFLGGLYVMAAALVLLALREGGGVVWMLWLILLVVVTDICGYFAGRLFGGPKFWPKVSPKKTWAGVLAGWAGAGLVGAVFIGPTGMGEGLILVSIFMSFASQLGDIAESALKRRAGVKDSSNLLPGHGGLLDRLDGVIGATLVLGLIAALTNFGQAPI